MATVGVAAGPAAAAPGGGGSLVAIGFGPSATLGGGLADEVYGAGAAARVRMGGRFGRVGAELVVAVTGLTTHDGRDAPAVLTGPSLAWYPVATPWFQLGARGGLSAGAINEERTTTGPCERAGTCTTTTTASHGGFALDLGVTAQLELGARRGGRLVLWLDVGTQLMRFQLDDRVVGGHASQITFGLGHGMAF
ncbi:MAG: hypothetical protein IPL61_39415 [Myxococcales bacterium]|nr:hypothetical protein [Myxococcales bacterium]